MKKTPPLDGRRFLWIGLFKAGFAPGDGIDGLALDEDAPVEVGAGGGAGAAEGADRLARPHEFTGFDFNGSHVEIDRGDPLTVIQTHTVAMDFKPIALIAHQSHTPVGGGNDGGSWAPP